MHFTVNTDIFKIISLMYQEKNYPMHLQVELSIPGTITHCISDMTHDVRLYG